MKEANVFIGSHPSVPRGSFEIHEIDKTVKEGDKVIESPERKLFFDKGDLAEDFFAHGIIQREIHRKKNVLLVRNPLDKFTLLE